MPEHYSYLDVGDVPFFEYSSWLGRIDRSVMSFPVDPGNWPLWYSPDILSAGTKRSRGRTIPSEQLNTGDKSRCTSKAIIMTIYIPERLSLVTGLSRSSRLPRQYFGAALSSILLPLTSPPDHAIHVFLIVPSMERQNEAKGEHVAAGF
jgi:hypothetical protein